MSNADVRYLVITHVLLCAANGQSIASAVEYSFVYCMMDYGITMHAYVLLTITCRELGGTAAIVSNSYTD